MKYVLVALFLISSIAPWTTSVNDCAVELQLHVEHAAQLLALYLLLSAWVVVAV